MEETMKKKWFVLSLTTVMLLWGVLFLNAPIAQMAPTDTVNYNGTIVGAPTFTRALADCSALSGVGVGVGYHVQGFQVGANGSYSFSSVQTYDGFLHLYHTAFDPTQALQNCLTGNDDGAGGIGTSDFTYTLTAGVQYFLVTSAFDPTESGTFNNTISGPGTITLGQSAPPEISVAPTSLTATLYVGSTSGYTVTEQLTIGNLGELDLEWSVLESDQINVPQAPLPGSVNRLGVPAPTQNMKGDFALPHAPTGGINQVQDGSFEAGTPNPYWTEASTNFGTPLCTVAACGTGTGTGPRTGQWWAWFGGIAVFEEGSMTQQVTIPTGATNLTFYTEAIICASANDYLEVEIDSTQVFLMTGASPQCGVLGYALQTVDISAYADGGTHTLTFHSITTGAGNTNFFVDDVELLTPDACQPDNLGWVSVSPTSGTTISGTQSTVDVTFDSTGLASGVYTGSLCVDSNDPVNGRVSVPLTLTVSAPTDVQLTTFSGQEQRGVVYGVIAAAAIIMFGIAWVARRSNQRV
jgi:hypothetical protein